MSVTHGDPDLLRPRIQKIKKTRYQRNVKIFIFTVVCLLIGMTLSHFQGGYVPVMSQWQNWPFSPVFDFKSPKTISVVITRLDPSHETSRSYCY